MALEADLNLQYPFSLFSGFSQYGFIGRFTVKAVPLVCYGRRPGLIPVGMRSEVSS